jgi:hypothetical protein
VVYREPGRFAGWPANYGMWHWGDEIVVVFVVGWLGPLVGVHARDTTRPFTPMQARSPDGGRTWAAEPFTGALPGRDVAVLSADEHVVEALRAAPGLSDADFAATPPGVDFTDPGTVVMCARTDLEAGSRSWFYVSRDRARSWAGPFAIPALGQPGVSARTDVVALDATSALFLLTAAKSDGHEGRVVAAVAEDGGTRFSLRSALGPEPPGFAIMPSSVRTAAGTIVTAVRCTDPIRSRHWIDLYRSDDDGRHWRVDDGPVVPDTGFGGNPPALAVLPDARLVLLYGYRDAPAGLRARLGDPTGTVWSGEIVLDAGGGMHDLGYPRCVVLADGTVVVCWYTNDVGSDERYIASLRWRP